MNEFKSEIFTLEQLVHTYKWFPIKYHDTLYLLTLDYVNSLTKKYKGREIFITAKTHKYRGENAVITSISLILDHVPFVNISVGLNKQVSIGTKGFEFL